MKFNLRKSKVEDCAALYGYLRKEDLREVSAAGVTSYAALRDGFDRSIECCTATAEDDKVIAMFGVSPVVPAGDEALVWFLGSRRVDDFKFEYLRWGKRYMAEVMREYRKAFNYCLADSVKTIRFLRLMGFKFLPEHDVTVNGWHWKYFEMEA